MKLRGLLPLGLLLVAACAGKSTRTDRVEPSADADEGAVRSKASACLGYDLINTVDLMLAGYEEPLGIQRSCIAQATDCDEVIRCTGAEPGTCDGPDHCLGSVAHFCDSFADGRTATRELDCGNDAAGNGACSEAEVGGDDVRTIPTCNAGACTASSCSGMAVNCYGDFEVREDCARHGRFCVQADGRSMCALPNMCESSHCDGSIAINCTAGLELERINCATRVPNGTCRIYNGFPGCFAPDPDPDCPTQDPLYRSWCQGKSIGVACVLGARITTDCSAFNGATCQELPNEGYARCALE